MAAPAGGRPRGAGEPSPSTCRRGDLHAACGLLPFSALEGVRSTSATATMRAGPDDQPESHPMEAPTPPLKQPLATSTGRCATRWTTAGPTWPSPGPCAPAVRLCCAAGAGPENDSEETRMPTGLLDRTPRSPHPTGPVPAASFWYAACNGVPVPVRRRQQRGTARRLAPARTIREGHDGA